MKIDPRLLDLVELDRELIRRRGLSEFCRQAWHVLEPATPLKWGWAMDAISDHLTAVTMGHFNRLLINVPPGMMKSLMAGVFWPAYEWGPRDLAHHRILGSSYSEDYATRDNRRMRDLVSSEWFQARWPLRLDQVGEKKFSNVRTGFRQGVPFVRLTGGRGHRVIIDDPHSTEGAESDADRLRAVRIFRESATTRLIDPITSAIVVIMQRLNTNDVSGEILASDQGYTHLMLPMEFEPERRCVTSIGFRDPRTEEGELLFPERFPREVVERDKNVMGAFATAGQFQQRPAPRGGSVVKETWLSNRYGVRGPSPLMIVQSWDCASKPKEKNDPSACLTFAVFKDRAELWDCYVGRLEFPDLFRKAKDKYAEFPGINTVLIEDKDAGQQLIQQLKRDTRLPVVAVNPGTLDKETRLRAETTFIEAGRLWLPDEAPWVSPYVDELTTFPGSPHKDRVDATSQFLKWLRENQDRFGPVTITSIKRAAPRPT